eukprot:1178052-Prorocentrum_minimum.AAC.2
MRLKPQPVLTNSPAIKTHPTYLHPHLCTPLTRLKVWDGQRNVLMLRDSSCLTTMYHLVKVYITTLLTCTYTYAHHQAASVRAPSLAAAVPDAMALVRRAPTCVAALRSAADLLDAVAAAHPVHQRASLVLQEQAKKDGCKEAKRASAAVSFAARNQLLEPEVRAPFCNQETTRGLAPCRPPRSGRPPSSCGAAGVLTPSAAELTPSAGELTPSEEAEWLMRCLRCQWCPYMFPTCSLNVLGNNLASSVRELRASTLRVLAHFPDLAVIPGGSAGGGLLEEGSIGAACSLMAWKDIMTCALNLDEGRHAQVALGKVQHQLFVDWRAQLEAGTVPAELVDANIRACVGAFYVPFSLFWDPAVDALAAALNSHHMHDAAFQVVLDHLQAAQTAALGSMLGADPTAEEEEETAEEEEGLEEAKRDAQGVRARFEALSASDPHCTDANVRLGLLLKAATKAAATSDRRLKQLAPLFLDYATVIPTNSEDVEAGGRLPGAGTRSGRRRENRVCGTVGGNNVSQMKGRLVDLENNIAAQ